MKDYKVDAVYVTRCKDCKKSNGINADGKTTVCFKDCRVVPAEHYCSYGERKQDGK